MTAFDYAVIALMAASIFLGLWRGVFGEIIAERITESIKAAVT